MIKLYKQAKAVAITLLLSLFLLPACSDEEGGGVDIPDGKLYTVTLSLAPSTNSTPAYTKANPDWIEEADPYERKLEQVWVAIFDEDKSWRAFVTSPNGIHINNGDADSESTAEVKLPVGKYLMYAFANLSSLDNGTELIEMITLGKKPDGTVLTTEMLEAVTTQITDASKFKIADGKPIPMSSYAKEVTVSETGTTDVEITMFRMIGKISITIENQTGEVLTLHNLSVKSFREGEISLIPYKTGDISLEDLTQNEETYKPVFPKNEDVEIAGTLKEHPVISGGDIKIESQYAFTPFYENETYIGTGATVMEIALDINDRGTITKPTNFSFMRRNDWLQIPLIVSNTEATLSFVNTRMPIGGIPPEVKFTDGVTLDIDTEYPVPSDYSGKLSIQFELTSLGSSISNFRIQLPIGEYQGKASSVKLLENKAVTTGTTKNEHGLLINKDTGAELTDGDITNLVTFTQGETATEGSFSVWLQELGKNAASRIELRLVAKYTDGGSEREVELPFKIKIQNYSTEGGNS